MAKNYTNFKLVLEEIDNIFKKNYKAATGEDIDPSKIGYKDIYNKYGQYYKGILRWTDKLSQEYNGAYFGNLELSLEGKIIKPNIMFGSLIASNMKDYAFRMANNKGHAIHIRMTDDDKYYPGARELSRFLAYYGKAYVDLIALLVKEEKVGSTNPNIGNCIQMKAKIDPKKQPISSNLKEMDNWRFKLNIDTKSSDKSNKNSEKILSDHFKIRLMDQVETVPGPNNKKIPKKGQNGELIYKPVVWKDKQGSVRGPDIKNIHEMLTYLSSFICILDLSSFSTSSAGICLKSKLKDITVKRNEKSDEALAKLSVEEQNEFGMSYDDIDFDDDDESIGVVQQNNNTKESNITMPPGSPIQSLNQPSSVGLPPELTSGMNNMNINATSVLPPNINIPTGRSPIEPPK